MWLSKLSTKEIKQNAIPILFRYELGNGNKFRGTTAFVMEKIEPNLKMKLFYNLLLDANKQTYWVTFTEREINSSECIVKTVNPGSLLK